MAKISEKNLIKIIKTNTKKHREVLATYSVYFVDGNKYFQLDTYGDPERKTPNRISQSVQIDKKAALKLVELLSDTFKLNDENGNANVEIY